MSYLVDTNIILHYLKKSKLAFLVEEKYKLIQSGHDVFISVVSIGELRAISLRNGWKLKRIRQLQLLLTNFVIIGINSEDILNRYAQIEAYSQGKLSKLPLPKGISARNMGKNDLWIAATSSIAEAVLLTADKDFQHLDGAFGQFAYVTV